MKILDGVVFCSRPLSLLVLQTLFFIYFVVFRKVNKVDNCDKNLFELGIFVLFVSFWLYLNMFQTLKWLAVLALPAFVSGNYMLTQIAAKRKNTTKQN